MVLGDGEQGYPAGQRYPCVRRRSAPLSNRSAETTSNPRESATRSIRLKRKPT